MLTNTSEASAFSSFALLPSPHDAMEDEQICAAGVCVCVSVLPSAPQQHIPIRPGPTEKIAPTASSCSDLRLARRRRRAGQIFGRLPVCVQMLSLS